LASSKTVATSLVVAPRIVAAVVGLVGPVGSVVQLAVADHQAAALVAAVASVVDYP